MVDWRPTASRPTLELRAALLTHARRFFADRGVLEVDTPVVVNAPVTDVHIHSARVQFADDPRPFFLHTSPEYAMKRLLAAGSGDIYQICHVVRGLERGTLHNAEFTLIEWYRTGYSLDQLMGEVDALLRHLLGDVASSMSSERISYREAFLRELRLDPFTASLEDLAAATKAVGFAPGTGTGRDELL
ncbi:MAG TPA: amino acid--tRNA ligase-related protein, partial [Chloroflexota bacterium]